MAARILVVDDERVVHTYLKGILEPRGHKVFAAVDAFQGPMMAQKIRPDLIVLDINMPGGGGYETLRRLRMSSYTMQTPVLIYTILPLTEVEGHVEDWSDLRYVTKPASPEALVEAVRQLLNEA